MEDKERKHPIDNAPAWRREIWEKELIKSLPLEEYEDLSEVPDEFAIWLWEIMDQCSSVYTVPPAFLRYGSRKLENKRVLGTAGAVDKQLAMGIKKKGIEPELVPLIPIMEFKLVPTGNVEYFDLSLTTTQRKEKRRAVTSRRRAQEKKRRVRLEQLYKEKIERLGKDYEVDLRETGEEDED